MKIIKNLALLGMTAALSLTLFACSFEDGKVEDNHSNSTKSPTHTAVPTSNTATNNAGTTDNNNGAVTATDKANGGTTAPSATGDMMDDIEQGAEDVKDGINRVGDNIVNGVEDTVDRTLPDVR